MKYAGWQPRDRRFLDVLATVDVASLTNAQLVQWFKLLLKYLRARMLHGGK